MHSLVLIPVLRCRVGSTEQSTPTGLFPLIRAGGNRPTKLHKRKQIATAQSQGKEILSISEMHRSVLRAPPSAPCATDMHADTHTHKQPGSPPSLEAHAD